MIACFTPPRSPPRYPLRLSGQTGATVVVQNPALDAKYRPFYASLRS